MLRTYTKMVVFPLAISFGVLFADDPSANGRKQDVTNSVNYFSIGVGPLPIPLPNFGFGHRIQNNHHGMDLSLKGSTIVYYSEVKGSILYDYYFKPDLNSQLYVGAGLGAGGLLKNKHTYDKPNVFISPEFVIGKQYRNEAKDLRFIQAEISWPTFSNHCTLYMPLVVFSYGFCF